MWRLAVRAGVSTMNGAIGGGLSGRWYILFQVTFQYTDFFIKKKVKNKENQLKKTINLKSKKKKII